MFANIALFCSKNLRPVESTELSLYLSLFKLSRIIYFIYILMIWYVVFMLVL